MQMLRATLRELHCILQQKKVNRFEYLQQSCFIEKLFAPGHVNVVRALIAIGAKVNAEDRQKYSPLHLAAIGGK